MLRRFSSCGTSKGPIRSLAFGRDTEDGRLLHGSRDGVEEMGDAQARETIYLDNVCFLLLEHFDAVDFLPM